MRGKTQASFSKVYMSGKIIRADGSVEDLGVIARQHKNPAINLLWRAIDTIKGKRPWNG